MAGTGQDGVTKKTIDADEMTKGKPQFQSNYTLWFGSGRCLRGSAEPNPDYHKQPSASALPHHRREIASRGLVLMLDGHVDLVVTCIYVDHHQSD